MKRVKAFGGGNVARSTQARVLLRHVIVNTCASFFVSCTNVVPIICTFIVVATDKFPVSLVTILAGTHEGRVATDIITVSIPMAIADSLTRRQSDDASSSDDDQKNC